MPTELSVNFKGDFFCTADIDEDEVRIACDRTVAMRDECTGYWVTVVRDDRQALSLWLWWVPRWETGDG